MLVANFNGRKWQILFEGDKSPLVEYFIEDVPREYVIHKAFDYGKLNPEEYMNDRKIPEEKWEEILLWFEESVFPSKEFGRDLLQDFKELMRELGEKSETAPAPTQTTAFLKPSMKEKMRSKVALYDKNITDTNLEIKDLLKLNRFFRERQKLAQFDLDAFVRSVIENIADLRTFASKLLKKYLVLYFEKHPEVKASLEKGEIGYKEIVEEIEKE